MQRRDFIQALAFSSVLATGIVKAKALPIGKQLTDEEISSAINQTKVSLGSSTFRSTTIRVGGKNGLRSLSELNDWMSNNTWDRLEILIDINNTDICLSECLNWIPTDLAKRNISITMQASETLQFNES